MVKLSAWLAIGVGVVVAVAQLLRNYDNLENWMSWTVDEFAALVLIVAGLLALRKQTTRLLPVGWSFACGLYASAVIGHLNALSQTSGETHVSEQRLVVIVGGLTVVALAGLAMVLFNRKPS